MKAPELSLWVPSPQRAWPSGLVQVCPSGSLWLPPLKMWRFGFHGSSGGRCEWGSVTTKVSPGQRGPGLPCEAATGPCPSTGWAETPGLGGGREVGTRSWGAGRRWRPATFSLSLARMCALLAPPLVASLGSSRAARAPLRPGPGPWSSWSLFQDLLALSPQVGPCGLYLSLLWGSGWQSGRVRLAWPRWGESRLLAPTPGRGCLSRRAWHRLFVPQPQQARADPLLSCGTQVLPPSTPAPRAARLGRGRPSPENLALLPSLRLWSLPLGAESTLTGQA